MAVQCSSLCPKRRHLSHYVSIYYLSIHSIVGSWGDCCPFWRFIRHFQIDSAQTLTANVYNEGMIVNQGIHWENNRLSSPSFQIETEGVKSNASGVFYLTIFCLKWVVVVVVVVLVVVR